MVNQLLVGDRSGFDPSRSTKSPHHSRTGVPTFIELPSNSRQGAGYILSKMSAANKQTIYVNGGTEVKLAIVTLTFCAV